MYLYVFILSANEASDPKFHEWYHIEWVGEESGVRSGVCWTGVVGRGWYVGSVGRNGRGVVWM